MNIKNYLWAFPFLSFLAGYFLLQKISNVSKLNAPALVGKQLQEAVAVLSDNNLNLRLITQKDDADLPAGTILSQTPSAGQNIKPYQALHVVVSKKPQKKAAPALIYKSAQQIEKILKKDGIRNKSYYQPSNCPRNSCIAQQPATGKPLETNKIVTYISSGNSKPVLLPDFRGKTATEAVDFLKSHHCCNAQISHGSRGGKNHVCDQFCIITHQRPLAGSIINLDDKKPFSVHLQAKSTN